MAKTKKYRVTSAIKLDGKIRQAGEVVEIDEALLEQQPSLHVEPVGEEPPPNTAPELGDMRVEQLRALALDMELEFDPKANKTALIEAIRQDIEAAE